MYFFAITPVTAGAAATLVGLSALYTSITGVPNFVDSDIPSAVFLGLHLLVTDPSTSPLTPLGRAFFGVLYGVGVFGLYSLLGPLGMPTFYDNLLCVPLMNLAVRANDLAVKRTARAICYRLALDGPLGRGNLAHMAVWVAFFAFHADDGRRRRHAQGRLATVWEQACARANRERARGCCGLKRHIAATTPDGRATSLAPHIWKDGSSNAIRNAPSPISLARARAASRPAA